MIAPIGKVLDEGGHRPEVGRGWATSRGEEACGCMGLRFLSWGRGLSVALRAPFPTRRHPRQSCEVTNRNAIQGRFDQASEHNIAKPFPVGRTGKWRACAAKHHALIRGDLPGGPRAPFARESQALQRVRLA